MLCKILVINMIFGGKGNGVLSRFSGQRTFFELKIKSFFAASLCWPLLGDFASFVAGRLQ